MHQNHLGGLVKSGIGPVDLHFEQVPRRCQCCWFKEHTLRITVLEHGHNQPKVLSSNLISISWFYTKKNSDVITLTRYDSPTFVCPRLQGGQDGQIGTLLCNLMSCSVQSCKHV